MIVLYKKCRNGHLKGDSAVWGIFSGLFAPKIRFLFGTLFAIHYTT
ncbi:MAG: hypothetical protein LBT46_06670 [Planctomycetaceae bacterium]|nr:hypothetical protein [Planctomycetaceae bacterium]